MLTDEQQQNIVDVLNNLLCILKDPRPYNISPFSVQTSGPVTSNCMDITFINMGTNVVLLNNVVPIAPGASLGFSANFNEVDKSIYTLTFPKDPTNTLTNNCIILKKSYI